MATDRKQHIDVITMGCSKNLVDSERLLKVFTDAGFTVRHNPSEVKADTVVVNTCGFIGDAKEESINMILECCEAKKRGDVKTVCVMGCLSERYKNDLPAEIPEVDRWYGKFDWLRLGRDMVREHPGAMPWERILTTPRHHAYVKISEGCNRFCAFCAIPLITGRHKSRPVDEILTEVKALRDNGTTEFNVIAQDLSSYGTDLYGESRLAELIDRMAAIEGVRRIRLHYAYPAQFPYDVLPVMRRHPNVCNYLDIALQHISDKVLVNMRRHITADGTRALLDRIRREVPGIHIRTTLMVGFPGEGEAEFNELVDFVKEQRFERMGAFAYCEEDDTFAARHLEDGIPDRVKQERLDILMDVQQKIALEHNESKVGKTFEVVIDSVNKDYYVGRTEFDSPEVDPEVLISRKDCPKILEAGRYYPIRITEALPFELVGKLVTDETE